jgi:DhnA family fructose-bisphosphate aldolase class Ia
MKAYRLNRLFNPKSGRCFDVAIDHGFFNEPTFLCVVVNLFRIPDQPELADQCIQNILRLKPECDRYAVPLMIEPLVFKPNEQSGGYMVDGDPDKIVPLVRQAAELGADVIKADPTDERSRNLAKNGRGN